MNWKQFLIDARIRGLLLQGEGCGELGLGDALLIPLRTPKDPRNIHDLVKLAMAYAYPAKRALIRTQMRDRLGKRADIENPETRTITWHHPWRFPEGENPDDYISLGEYLKDNGFNATT